MPVDLGGFVLCGKQERQNSDKCIQCEPIFQKWLHLHSVHVCTYKQSAKGGNRFLMLHDVGVWLRKKFLWKTSIPKNTRDTSPSCTTAHVTDTQVVNSHSLSFFLDIKVCLSTQKPKMPAALFPSCRRRWDTTMNLTKAKICWGLLGSIFLLEKRDTSSTSCSLHLPLNVILRGSCGRNCESHLVKSNRKAKEIKRSQSQALTLLSCC